MSIDKFYIKFLKIFLPLFVVTLPLANRDIFSIYFSRIFPVRVILIFVIFVSGASLAFWLISQWGRGEALKKMISWVGRDFLLKLLLILLAIRLISIKNSLNYSASVDLLLFYLSMIALYIILRFVYEREGGFLAQLLKLHLFMVCLVALFGMLQLLLSFFGIRLPGVLVGSTFVRIPATFYDANHLPPYLLTAFPSLFIYFFYVKKEYQKFVLGLLLSVFALVLLFTFSRSGFISFSLVFMILGFVFLKRRYFQKLLTVGSVFLFAAIIIFLTSQTQLSIFKRLSSVFNIEDKSTVAHGLLTYGGLELLKESPVIGLGYGSFSEHFRRSALGREHATFDTATDVRIPAHSIWLEVLVETGIVGFAVYLWFMISVLEAGYRSLPVLKNKRDYLLHLALLCSMVGILVSGIFYSYNLEFFWFFIFMVYFQSRRALEAGSLEVGVAEVGAEPVPWRLFRYGAAVLIVASSLILNGLSYVPILPGNEGIIAVAGRDMRASWGYNNPQWWLPRYDGGIIAAAPLPVWISAFWTFLFDFGVWVPRFLPALAGILGLLVVFLWAASIEGTGLGILSVLTLLASPGLLGAARLGGSLSYSFFVSAVAVLLTSLITKGRRYLTFPLVFLLAAFSLVSYEGYFILLVLLLAFFWNTGSLWGRLRWPVLGLLAASFFPLLSWALVLKSVAHLNLFSQINFLNLGAFQTAYFLALPLLSLVFLKAFYKSYGRVIAPVLIFLAVLSFYSSVLVKGDPDLTGLMSARMAASRDGRVPLYVLEKINSDSRYYTQVPTQEITVGQLKEKFAEDNHFFAILNGGAARALREEAYGFTTTAASGNLILIERPGKIK